MSERADARAISSTKRAFSLFGTRPNRTAELLFFSERRFKLAKEVNNDLAIGSAIIRDEIMGSTQKGKIS